LLACAAYHYALAASGLPHPHLQDHRHRWWQLRSEPCLLQPVASSTRHNAVQLLRGGREWAALRLDHRACQLQREQDAAGTHSRADDLHIHALDSRHALGGGPRCRAHGVASGSRRLRWSDVSGARQGACAEMCQWPYRPCQPPLAAKAASAHKRHSGGKLRGRGPLAIIVCSCCRPPTPPCASSKSAAVLCETCLVCNVSSPVQLAPDCVASTLETSGSL